MKKTADVTYFFDWFALVANWTAQTTITLISVLVAAGVAIYVVERTHRRAMDREDRARELRIQGNLAGLVAELKLAGRMAAGYLADNVSAPLYRIPLNAFERSLPALMADRVLSAADIETLMDFYANAASINLGLAQAHEALIGTASTPRTNAAQYAGKSRAEEILEMEEGRLKVKCEKGRPRGGETPSHYDRAAQVLAKHLADPATRQALGL